MEASGRARESFRVAHGCAEELRSGRFAARADGSRVRAGSGGRLFESEWTLAPVVEELFGQNAIKDDLLRMMFSCCHSRLPEEAQIALILHILCGFSVDEIAGAFVSTPRSGLHAQRKCSRNRRGFSAVCPCSAFIVRTVTSVSGVCALTVLSHEQAEGLNAAVDALPGADRTHVHQAMEHSILVILSGSDARP